MDSCTLPYASSVAAAPLASPGTWQPYYYAPTGQL
jgi:hypothetical protein